MRELELPLNFEMAATDGDGRPSRCATARTPPASCRRSARSAPPRAGSTSPASTTTWRRSSRGCATPASACRCSSRPTSARSRRRRRSARRSSSCTPAPIASCEGAAQTAELAAPAARRAALCARLGLEVHAGHGLTYDNVGAGRGDPRGARAQHRPLPDRRGDLHRPRRRDPRMRRLMDAAPRRAGPPRDHRPRQRPQRHPPHREDAGALRRPLHQAHLHRDRAASAPRAARRAPPPTPSASPPRRPAPRRWAPACAAACSGATWAWSTCAAASRPWR